ncbi:hypothetical protein EV401DRAFT_1887578 [Pisolithus croceorrhizus]|nr:hypothetical protein EV401DRAFT_1887578 [Pisolithus croceorrhizus]
MGISGGFGEDCSWANLVLFYPHHWFNLVHVCVKRNVQTYLYYMHYSEDSSLMKLLVAAIWILDSLHVSFSECVANPRLIINYGVPAALEYIVWSYQVTVLMNCFFAHKIHYRMPYSTFPRDFTNWLSVYCRKVRWFVTVPIYFNRVWLETIHNKTSMLTQTWVVPLRVNMYYGVTPSVGTVVLAEILITVSLCVLLYDNGLRSTVPRTKRLVNSLITYAANRCLLTLRGLIQILRRRIVAVAELGVNADQQAAWTMGLNFIIGKPSLNTRQYLRSRDSGPEPDGLVNTVHLANPSKHSEDGRSSKNVGGRFDVLEVAVVCTTTTITYSEPVFDKTPIL